jgi:tetratricopeptide (TPR) repeat protein
MFRSERLEINRSSAFIGYMFLMLAFSFPVQGEASEYDSSLAPESLDYYAYNGWYLMNSGDFEGALPFYDLALEIDGDNVEYLSERGFCNFSIGNLESAIDDLTAALELDSLRIEDYEILGRAHSENGNLNESYYWFTLGIELSHDAEELSALHLYRARCYRLAGDYESAHFDLNRAIYYNPSTPFPHSRKGELYYLSMRDEDAVESFSKAIDLGITDGYLADVLFQRALSYMEMKEFDAAVADITELLRHEPGRVNAYYFRGMSYFYQGDDERFVDDLEHFLEVGSDPRLIPEARNILRDSQIFRQ